jgi:SAM-dependent methyltransferase
MAEPTDPWNTPAFLRDVQYRTDANLAARQSIYAYQHPRIDLQARVIDLAAPAPGETVADVGCGNGAYLAELARRGFAGRVLGLDMSPGMLAAARERLTLDDGEALARSCFSTVTRHDFVAELRLPDPQPIADYVRSMSGTQHSADPERLVAAVVARLPAASDAVPTITTHTGCLICEL